MNKILFSSDRTDWETPLDLFIKLDQEFNFDVDLCANDKNHLCRTYFSEFNSCLDKEFYNKSIYCNPPYSRSMYKFIKKCYELSKNNIVVMLLPCRTDTKWFHDFIYNKAEIRFIKGRLKFGGSKNSAPFPSMVVVYNGYKR